MTTFSYVTIPSHREGAAGIGRLMTVGQVNHARDALLIASRLMREDKLELAANYVNIAKSRIVDHAMGLDLVNQPGLHQALYAMTGIPQVEEVLKLVCAANGISDEELVANLA